MVSTNDKVQFDFNADFCDSNYKSCFARSCVVNSQFNVSKSLDLRQLQKDKSKEELEKNRDKCVVVNNQISASIVEHVIAAARKDSTVPNTLSPQSEDVSTPSRRLSCCSSSSGSRTPSRRGSDFPVENIALQNQVDTLQWQLKQAEQSRHMYRAVMQQVVGFLERAHRSLDLLSEKQRVVQRSRSEYHVASNVSSPVSEMSQTISSTGNADSYSMFRDYTWRRPKKQPTAPDEISPDKLSQEAFRLLRTAQSLLNTREPDLAHILPDISNPKDQEFLSQLAKEFPSRPLPPTTPQTPQTLQNPHHPQRATSFSINPQLLNPSDREIRISTAFNRKLSLQRTPSSEARRNLIDLIDITDNKRNSLCSVKKPFEADKPPSSPKTGSVSSAEDESGFSSMNSFQEVGLPLINSTVIEQSADNSFISVKNGDLSISVNSSDSNITQIEASHEESQDTPSKLLWNRSNLGLPVNAHNQHRRWSSTPVEMAQNDGFKVLWV